MIKGFTFFALIALSIQVFGQPVATTITVLDAQSVFPSIPSVSGNTMAFVDYRNSVYSLYKVDLKTMQEQIVSSNIGYTEAQVRISDEQVAWIGYPTSTQSDVYVRNLSTNTTTKITNDASYQNFPDIQGNKVVWQDYRNATNQNKKNADIYFYDLTTLQTKQITTSTYYQTAPSVWGNRIVWEDYRNAQSIATNADIYLYDVSTNQEIQISSNNTAQIYPYIWEDKIVWEDYRNGVGDIYMYDLSTNTERAISTFNSYKTHPVIYKNWIVWQDYRNGATQADLYGFDLITNKEYPIIVQADHQDYPQLDSLNLVWLDFRNSRQDIYLATLIDNSPSGVTDNEGNITGFELCQNYPNPFNPSTTIRYGIPFQGNVTIDVYNMIGQKIVSLIDAEQEAGYHEVSFNAEGLSSGVYLYSINIKQTNGNYTFRQSKKMALVK